MPSTIVGPGPLRPPPRAGTPVDRLVLTGRVHVPDDPTSLCVVRTEVTVEIAGEHHPGDDADCGWLARVAPLPGATRVLDRWRVPGNLTVGDPDGGHASRPPGRLLENVRGRDVGHLTIDGEAPLNPAEQPSVCDAHLPTNLPGRAIQPEQDPGLLTGQQDGFSVRRDCRQNRRAPEVVVRPLVFGTVGRPRPRRGHARNVPRVPRRRLRDPEDIACVHLECHDGIGRRGGRLGVRVAGGDVETVVLWVQRGSRPDSGTGRPPRTVAGRIGARRSGLLGNDLPLPELGSGQRVERHDAPPERAAFIRRDDGRRLFERRDRHLQPAGVQGRGARDPFWNRVFLRSPPSRSTAAPTAGRSPSRPRRNTPFAGSARAGDR